jgi:hypothetical protein
MVIAAMSFWQAIGTLGIFFLVAVVALILRIYWEFKQNDDGDVGKDS